MTTRERIAYCAGLFDGEGYVGIRKWTDKRQLHIRRQHIRYLLYVEITQVRYESVHFMWETLGGRVFFQKSVSQPHKYTARWKWSDHGPHAVKILQAMMPFLRLKTEEAKLGLEFQATMMNRKLRSVKLGLTQDEIANRERLYLEMRRLKQLHYTPELKAKYASMPRLSRPVPALNLA